MLSYATKLLIALTGAAFVAAAVFYGVVGERSGMLLMLFVGLAALLALITVAGSGVVDIAPDVPADAPAPEARATTPGQPGRASMWPLAAAAAVAVLAIGAATELAVVYIGIVAVLIAGIGWFGKAWTDHSTWTPRVSSRIADRFVAPVTLPLFGTLLAAVIAISLSRIYLAVSVAIAPWITLVLAMAIFAACAWVASRPRLGSSVVMALGVLALASTVGAGIAGAAQGERKFHPHGHDEHVIKLVAKDVNFTKAEVTAPAETEVEVELVNEDEEIFHNVAFYESEKLDAKPIYNGPGFPGHEEQSFTFKTPKAGKYAYRCDFHVNMVGTFVVEGG